MAHTATQQSKTRIHIYVYFLLSLLSLSLVSASNPVLERASYEILHNKEDNTKDTKAIEDPFLSLRPHEREAILTDPVFETGRDLADLLSAIVNFDDNDALVEVKLVGFDDIKATELLPYLEALNTADTLHALDKKSDDIQQVKFERKTMLTVKHAPASLFESVSRVIASYATTSTVVPYDVVDEIIKADFVAGGAASNVIYIMNMPRQKLDYVYSQYESGKQHQRESCVTSMWAGKERYTWIDVRAGPLAYGPQLVGDGYVDMETLPYSNKYESLKSGKVKVDIASYVYQTHKPSLTRFPLPWTTVDIHLVMIHDHEVGGHEESEMFNWAAIQEQILSIPVLRGQKINFLKSQKSLITDDTCALIKASSLKTYANLQRTAKESKVITNHYLDSKELHHYLSVFKNQLIGESREAPGLTIPIFLFDISYKNDILLLDRVHQAVSFPDMVIAIQTQHPHVSTDYVCNGNTVHIDPRDATRPVLASLLQSIWGIAPTHQSWNPALNKGETNYLWSVSSTPFAPFSIHYNLSFAQGDAAARHMVYSKIEQLMSPLADKIEHFMDYSYELSDFLDEEEYTHFMQRWNFLQFKTSEVKKYLTLNLFNASLAFVESAQFDVDALSNHLAEVHGRVHSFIKCGETTVDYVSLSSVVVTVIMGVIVAALLIRKLSSKLRRAKKVKNY